MAPPFFARKAEFTKRRENQTDRGSFRARPLLFVALTDVAYCSAVFIAFLWTEDPFGGAHLLSKRYFLPIAGTWFADSGSVSTPLFKLRNFVMYV